MCLFFPIPLLLWNSRSLEEFHFHVSIQYKRLPVEFVSRGFNWNTAWFLHPLNCDKRFHPSLTTKKGNPNALTLFWSRIGSNTFFLRKFRKREGKGYSQVESGRTPFWKDATWRPFLQPTGSHTLCWPSPLTTFQNFCGTIAQCFKISFQSTKKQKWKKKKKSAFLLLCRNLQSALGGLERRHRRH